MSQPEKLRKIVTEAILESELPRTLVAKDAGLGRATLEAWISGMRNPSRDSLAQIADGLERRANRLQRLALRIRKALDDSD